MNSRMGVSKRVVAATLLSAAFSTLSGAALAGPVAPDDIRDIRPPILFPPWWPWVAASVAAALVVAAAFLFVRYWRKRSALPLTPYERAQSALKAAESLAREGRYREWADLVAETLRSALGARVGREILPQTTSELASTQWNEVPPDVNVDASQLLHLLVTCDLTRFAKARLTVVDLVAETAAACDWTTRLFTPKPSPEPQPVALQASPVNS